MKKTLAISVLMALAIGAFAQEYIQQPIAISTWTYVADYGAELPFNKDISLQYDERGNLSYYYHVINYPNSFYTNAMWFTYDALNRLSFKQTNYQEANQFGTSRYYYTYDVSSNLVECLVKIRDRQSLYYTNDFVNDSKDVYQYENGKKTRWEHFKSNYGNAYTLVLQYYYLYDYSDSGNWSSETKYNADEQPVTKTEYTYSDTQEILTKTVSNWSAETETWLNSSLTENTYSDQHLLLSKADFNWSDATGTWLNSSLTEYEYNDNGNFIEKRVTKWSAGEISEQKKELYSYDENGNCSQILFQTLADSVYADQNRATYLYDENNLCTNANAERWVDTAWVLGGFPYGTYLFFGDIYSDVNNAIGSIAGCTRAEVTDYVTTPNPQYLQAPMNLEGEWYYEILNDDGSITYQHREYAADTTIGTERPKVIVRSNTQYDRDTITEVTHEYVYEENGKVYWWNKELEEFTILYDLAANTGDEWEIKVGTETITMHVDTVTYFELNELNIRMLSVSDTDGIFSGDIVCSFGHMTSFFPERLMRNNADFEVNGLRCYWVGDILLYHNGDEDCDAIHSELQGLDDGPSTGSGTLVVYPNPADGVVFVRPPQCDSPTTGHTYRITNLMGQTLLQGRITADKQQINIESLPAGMYFITFAGETLKFVVE